MTGFEHLARLREAADQNGGSHNRAPKLGLCHTAEHYVGAVGQHSRLGVAVEGTARAAGIAPGSELEDELPLIGRVCQPDRGKPVSRVGVCEILWTIRRRLLAACEKQLMKRRREREIYETAVQLWSGF